MKGGREAQLANQCSRDSGRPASHAHRSPLLFSNSLGARALGAHGGGGGVHPDYCSRPGPQGSRGCPCPDARIRVPPIAVWPRGRWEPRNYLAGREGERSESRRRRPGGGADQVSTNLFGAASKSRQCFKTPSFGSEREEGEEVPTSGRQ